jgi:hypothetical protein
VLQVASHSANGLRGRLFRICDLVSDPASYSQHEVRPVAGDIKLVHLDPLLQRLRLLLASSFRLMDLPPDRILKRAQLPRFQPPKRLVPTV